MNCRQCGHSNAEDAERCSRCSASLGAGASEISEAPTIMSGGDPSETPTEVLGRHAPGPARHAPLEAGQRLGSRYEILSILGEGGFGAVYKARDLELNRTVALKVIHPALVSAPSMLERFKREILLASQITHKNVVRIHDMGEVGEIKFISMMFIEGSDLKELILREAPFSVERTVALLRQIGEALEAAHEAGVVHRDLKPQNVLVDEAGNAFIADFGISRSEESGKTLTETGSVMGTVAYMSPEQARGDPVDQRSDIYSLGLILYEMLTGSLPFQADDAMSSLSALMKRVQEDVPSLAKLRPELPSWLVRIVSRSLERDLAARYPNVGELLADVERQRTAFTWRRLLRGPLPRVAAGVVAAGLLVGAGLMLWPTREPSVAPVAVATGTSLALVPFRNVSGDASHDWTRTGLPNLLRSELQQSTALRLVGEDRVSSIVEGLKLQRGDGLQPGALERISNLTGVENLLTGDLFTSGDRFRIEAHLLRAGAGSITRDVPLRVEGRGDDALFAMVDELGLKIREELGISAGWNERRRDASELSTDSVEALRLYSEAVEQVRAGGDLEAAKRLELALELDPQFATARAALAESYDRLGRFDQALREAETAAEALRKVSPYESARIGALRARLAGDAETAGAAYRELCRLEPNRPEAFLALGSFQEETGDLEGARDSLRRAIELDPQSPSARYVLGRVLAKLGNAGEARQELERALGIHVDSGNAEGRATVLNGLGNVSRILGEFDDALRYFRETLEVREEIGDLRGTGVALNNIATILMDLGHYDEAIEGQKRSLAAYEELGDDIGLADAHANLGDIFVRAGRAEQALDAYQTGLDVLRDTGDEASLARAFGNLGYIYTVLGRYNEAFFFQKDALAARRELGDRVDLAYSLIDIGLLEQVQGRYEEALKYYAEGLELSREIGEPRASVAFSANLAQIHHDQGEYAAALSLLSEGEAAARELGEKNQIATCLAYRGLTQGELGARDEARAAFDEALELARELGIASLEATILTGQGALLLGSGQRERAQSALRDAVSAAEASKDRLILLQAKLRSAEAAGSAGELEQVMTEAESRGLKPLVGLVRLSVARLRLAQSRHAEAREEAQRAIEAAGPLRQRDLLFQAHHVAARALERESGPEAAVEERLRALALLEEMRQGLEGPTLAAFLGRERTRAYAEESERLLRSIGRDAELARLQAAIRP